LLNTGAVSLYEKLRWDAWIAIRTVQRDNWIGHPNPTTFLRWQVAYRAHHAVSTNVRLFLQRLSQFIAGAEGIDERETAHETNIDGIFQKPSLPQAIIVVRRHELNLQHGKDKRFWVEKRRDTL
jgi:hypothetical protein